MLISDTQLKLRNALETLELARNAVRTLIEDPELLMAVGDDVLGSLSEGNECLGQAADRIRNSE